jgi:hypothetical protein
MKLLSDDKGNFSSVRVGMFISLITACTIGIIAILHDAVTLEVGGLVSSYLAAGFGAKVWQKFAEAGTP